MDLPVTVVGGYLGAGKTTLINHLLRHNEGLRLAVLVNEFGELSIDADLIEAEEDGLISLSGGCVCCSFGGDLIGALEDMLARDPRPDHLLIEASGVALPASIATTVSMIQGLRPDGVLVLADAEQVRRNAASPYLGDTIDRQLRQADLILLTKTDLVHDTQREAVTAWLRGRAPGARILPLDHGAAPIGALLGALPFPARHGATTDTHARFETLLLTPAATVDAEVLAQALAAQEGVTRAKGFVQTADGLSLIHVVGTRGTAEPATGHHEIGVVCIGPSEIFDAEALRGLVA